MTLPGPTTVFLAAMIFLVILGVGLSLSWDGFREAFSATRAIVTALLCQFVSHFFIKTPAEHSTFSLVEDGELIVLLLTPIIAGMVIRARWSLLASRLTKLARLLTAWLLALTVIAVVLLEHAHVLSYLRSSGTAATIFCAISLVVGYLAIRVQRLPQDQAVSVGMAVGVHNGSLAVAIALSPGLLVIQNLPGRRPFMPSSLCRSPGWRVGR